MICPDSFQVINIRLIAISRDYLVEENSNTISHNSNKCSNRNYSELQRYFIRELLFKVLLMLIEVYTLMLQN